MSKRKRVRIKARELTDVDVDYISIVSRGANRIPFRILKAEDNEMLDLSRIFFRKEEPKTPALVAVAVAKGANAEAIMAAVREQYTVTSEAEMDGATLMKFDEDADLSDVDIVKMSDDLAVFVANVQKGLVSYPDSVSFMKNISKAGFLPSLRMATDVLMETVYNVVNTPGDSTMTVEKLESSLGEYQNYVLGMVRSMPEQVFKFESPDFHDNVETIRKGMLDSEQAKANSHREEPVEEAPKEEKPKAAAKPKEETKKEDAPASDTDVTETEVPETADKGVASEVVKSQDDSNEKLLESIKSMFGAQIETLKSELTSEFSTRIGEMGEQISTLTQKVEDTEKVAKAADEAVRGTVHAGSESDDATPTRTKKSEKGLFDDVLKFPGFEIV